MLLFQLNPDNLFFHLKKIANTGQLCCVAAGPHGRKSPVYGGENSVDHDEPHWQTNSSFSPPPFRIWDCRTQSDGLPHGSDGGQLRGSSLSSNNSRGSRSRVGSGRFSNHHHSVSDGILSYNDGSPSENMHAPRWTSPVPKFNLGELSEPTTVGGSRSQISWLPHSTERRYPIRAAAASPNFSSPSSLSESNQLESTSKRPFSFSNRNFPGRRSYTSKAVYPLMFRNPVSDCETFGDADSISLGLLTPSEEISPSHWLDNNSSIIHKFHKTLTELQASPDLGASSRRDGFRWSSASSYDFGFDGGDRFDIADNVYDVDGLRSPINPNVGHHKCGVCSKLLGQKSPWSSHRIMRGGDMPTAGVLPCGHVFHAECLEQLTPKTQIHDPPCPLCLKTIRTVEESPSVSEPLQMALRSVRRNKGLVISEAEDDHVNNDSPSNSRLRRNLPQPKARWNESGSLIKNHLKRHFTFKGKTNKDKEISATKAFRKIGSSASSKEPIQHHSSME